MKILSLHAFYQVLGGEDISHRSEVAHLRHSGHVVHDYTVQNSDYSMQSPGSQARDLLFNRKVFNDVVSICSDFSPEVAYVNNTFPGLSTSVFSALSKSGVPSIHVLRNYRIGCMAGTIFRDGVDCELCVGTRLGISGVQHSCYRGSRSASVAASGARVMQSVLGRRRHPTSYVAVSAKVREIAIRSGIPGSAIAIRHNLVWPETAFYQSALVSEPGLPSITFVGRDVPEKGLSMLIDSLPTNMEFILNIVGDVSRTFNDHRIAQWGQLGRSDVLDVLRRSRAVVVPSLWHEPFGRVVIEGLSVGTPAIVSSVGGMAGLVGVAVKSYARNDSEALARLIRESLLQTASELNMARQAARSRFADEFSADAWLRQTEQIFESTISSHRKMKDG